MAITKKMVMDCMRREIALSLPVKKKTNHHHQRPLWAWMQGAKLSAGPSRIEAVIANQCRWPWRTLNASGHTFVHRVFKKKTLPWLQKNWLLDFISRRYQGSYGYSRFQICHDHNFKTNKLLDANEASLKTWQFFESCLDKLGVKYFDVPLRLILSAELSALINLKFMEYYK